MKYFESARWQSELVPAEPDPALYSTFKAYETAMLNWAEGMSTRDISVEALYILGSSVSRLLCLCDVLVPVLAQRYSVLCFTLVLVCSWCYSACERMPFFPPHASELVEHIPIKLEPHGMEEEEDEDHLAQELVEYKVGLVRVPFFEGVLSVRDLLPAPRPPLRLPSRPKSHWKHLIPATQRLIRKLFQKELRKKQKIHAQHGTYIVEARPRYDHYLL